jgi:hypothetical protein
MQVMRKDPQTTAGLGESEFAAKGQHRPVTFGTRQSFASCRLCKDTGRLNNADRLHHCWCAAGVAARKEDREHRRSIREVTISTRRENSAGTVSALGSCDKSIKLGRSYMVGSDDPIAD